MNPLKRSPLAEQTARHLLEGIRNGQWGGTLPGVLRLAGQLGVSKDTVREALRQLENAGHLRASQPGVRRSIKPSRNTSRRLRIGILLTEPLSLDNRHSQTLLMLIREGIEKEGFACFFTEFSVQELSEKLSRITKMMREAKADAWILYVGRKDVVEWLAKKQVPVFCIGGYTEDLPHYRVCPVAGIRAATRDLICLGHQRIVLIVPSRLRVPLPLSLTGSFIESMAEAGLAVSSFNLPDWEPTPDGLWSMLEQLFRVTPPTALLIFEPGHALEILSFLARRGLKVPEDVSLLSVIDDPIFHWHRPSLATLYYPVDQALPSIVEWLHGLQSGSPFRGSKVFESHYIAGDSIGPAPAAKPARR